MGKRSKAQSPEKMSKHEKKQPLNNLIKILRPKVYITNSTNFKDLVQELTGNTNTSPDSSPPPSLSSSLPITRHVLPFIRIEDHAYKKHGLDLSFAPSCFSTPLEGSPDLQVEDIESFDYELEDIELGSQKNVGEYGDLESFLMEMDSISLGGTCCNYGMTQQEVCAFDYDLSTLI